MGDPDVRWEELERQLAGFEPIASRLRPPRTRSSSSTATASSRRLIVTDASLVVVSAPAGAGKSIALGQWVEREARPAAWLQLDADDNDPVRPAAVPGCGLGAGGVGRPGRARPAPAARSAGRSSACCRASDGSSMQAPPFVLVLDDAHLVTDDDSWRADRVPARPDCRPARTLAIGTPQVAAAADRPAARRRRLCRSCAWTDLAMDRDEARELRRAQRLSTGRRRRWRELVLGAPRAGRRVSTSRYWPGSATGDGGRAALPCAADQQGHRRIPHVAEVLDEAARATLQSVPAARRRSSTAMSAPRSADAVTGPRRCGRRCSSG